MRHKKQHKYLIVTFGILCVSFFGINLLLTHQKVADAELKFTEYSVLGEQAGSVMPASCDSVPPTAHFDGDCPALEVCPAGQYRKWQYQCIFYDSSMITGYIAEQNIFYPAGQSVTANNYCIATYPTSPNINVYISPAAAQAVGSTCVPNVTVNIRFGFLDTIKTFFSKTFSFNVFDLSKAFAAPTQ